MLKYSKIVVKVPDINKPYTYGKVSYSDPASIAANTKMVRNIYQKYKTSIDKWGTLFETGHELLIGFIATESAGTMAPPNRFKATGLMQMTPAAVFDSARKWKSEVDSDLPSEVRAALEAKVPTLFKAKSLTSEIQTQILNALQKDADFNIMTGTMAIRWLLERFSSPIFGGQINKVLVAYNAGPYRRILQSSPVIDTATLVASTQVPLESRGYLLKMLGKDGFLQLLVKDKVLTK